MSKIRHQLRRGWPLVAIACSLACGEAKQKAFEVPGGGAGAVQLAGCAKGSCDPAQVDYSATVAATGELVGFAQENVDWHLYGLDLASRIDDTSSTRRVMILLDRVPEGADVTPGRDDGRLAPEVSIQWRPPFAASGTMDVILRDFDRCVAEKDEVSCSEYRFLDTYDKKLTGDASLRWRIVDRAQAAAAAASAPVVGAAAPTGQVGGTVVGVGNPNCGGLVPTSDQQIRTQVLGTLFRALVSPSSLIPTVMGSLINGVAGQSAQPTQC